MRALPTAGLRRRLARGRRTRRESGYVAVVVALVLAGFGFGCAAIAVDVSRWWLEAQRVQKTADVAALGGVTYLPTDFDSATTAAIDVSSRNDFPNSGTSTVTTALGKKPSQLRVTVCSRVSNSFGALLGVQTTKVCRTAVADYTGPAPMGSPCNTFGNEPTAGGGSASATPAGSAQSSTPFANCSKRPQFWATIEGPQTDKLQGDQFQTKSCGSTIVDGCNGDANAEYRPEGYFWLVHVQPRAVGKTIDLQLYDPAYNPTAKTANGATTPCGSLPNAANWTNAANDYVTDAQKRYANVDSYSSSTQGAYCSGDSRPGGSGAYTAMNTSFALRQQTDTQDPTQAEVQDDTSGNACIRQFRGSTAAPVVNDLTQSKSAYDDQLARTFHNWYSFCRFTPARAGDYYLQVRSDVALGGYGYNNTNGNPIQIGYNNTNVLADAANTTTGEGNNAFAVRAVAPGYENDVSVSGYDRMPIYANADSATSTFNLIRVIPAGAGKSIQFTFFDAGDASTTGTVKVIPPTDAKTSGNNQKLSTQSTSVQFPGGCRALGGNAGTTGAKYADCKATIQGGNGGANNGRTETLVIPIPNDYTCTNTSLGGCWYQVEVSFAGGANVTDVTTWTAQVTGDPVRLVE